MKKIALFVFVAVTSFCSGRRPEHTPIPGDTPGGTTLRAGAAASPIPQNVPMVSR
jgi:hypothetical protein